MTEWTVQKILGLKLVRVMELFKALPAPAFTEMHGEYRANLTDHGSLLKNLQAQFVMQTSFFDGVWLCKSFEPLSETEGHGYNSFRKSGRIVRKYPMKTAIVSSRFDGKPVFQLDYTAYKSLLGFINMVDEIRKINDNLYLGVGTWGFTKKERMKPLPFTLSGPADQFVSTDKVHKRLK